jgi:hypothetical protein
MEKYMLNSDLALDKRNRFDHISNSYFNRDKTRFHK